MVALTYHNFTSAAVGMAVAAALVRGITRGPGATVGNFWNDLVRVTCLILLPASLVLSVLLASQGVIQNFDPPTRAATLEGREQIMAQGPVASQAAIKILGTNDAPALAQADVGVAMNTGSQAAREAGNMVDLDSNPTKLIEIVGIGKQLLMTRGALTTFSLANDAAKYFAILPAMLVSRFPCIEPLNLMRLSSPQSAILSAVIFNALILVALIPLALKGVPYRPMGAAAVLRRHLLTYGLGGLAAPFAGIKLLDLLVARLLPLP
jgi:high-affinity K+ transport system ATPase subunit B